MFQRFGLSIILAFMISTTTQAVFVEYFKHESNTYEISETAVEEQNYISNLLNPVTEDFESFSSGDSAPFSLSFGSIFADFYGDTSFDTIQNFNDGGRFATSGSNYLNHFSDKKSSITIEFSSHQNAIGFYATDVGGAESALIFDLYDGDTNIATYEKSGPGNSRAMYWGLIGENSSDIFDKIVIKSNSSAIEGYGLDDITINGPVNVVPEPTALLLFSTGLLGVFLKKR